MPNALGEHVLFWCALFHFSKLDTFSMRPQSHFLRILACCSPGPLHGAGSRPLNSALEVDLDFERGIKPPPQPTEEAAVAIEDLIRKRIADHRFDDPERLAVAAPEVKKTTLELDDARSKQVGLAILVI